jgi:hypothetical protein
MDMGTVRPAINEGRMRTAAAGGACGVAGQRPTEATLRESARYLTLWYSRFQRTCHTESGHLLDYRHFEGKLPLRYEGLAAGGVLLHGPVLEDPAGQLRVDGFLDPLIEQRGNLSAQVRRVIQP